MSYYYPGTAWTHIVPTPHQRSAPQLPRVGHAKQGIRIALSERLAHNPLQPLATRIAPWQRIRTLEMNEQASLPAISPDDLIQGEMRADQLFLLIEFVNACSKSTNRYMFVRRTTKDMVMTKLGSNLANVLPTLVHLVRSDCDDLRFEPRIEGACAAFVEVGLNRMTVPIPQPWQFQEAAWVTLFEEFGDLIRLRQRSASAGRAQQLHEDYHRNRLREVRGYYSKVARAHPLGYLVRVELEVALDGSADHHTRFLHMRKLSGDFLRRVAFTYGDAVVADARLIDRAGGNGYQAHVALVFEGPNHSEMTAIKEALPGIWRDLAATGRLRDTNAMPNFQYRGTGAEYREYESLASQLDKAAIYMAGTSEIFRVSVDRAPDELVLAEVSDINPTAKKK